MERKERFNDAFFSARQEDVSRHESEDRGARPSPAVLHRHGHRARGQQEIQVVKVGQISFQCLCCQNVASG